MTKYNKLLLFILTITLIIIPVKALATSYAPPQLSSEAAVLIDAKTGQVLFEKNMNQQLYPASITKILTGIIALENGNLEDTMTMSREAVFSIGRNTSHIALDTDEELTLKDALYGLAIESGNDAANGISEYISGDLESFAALMNEKAVEYGALNSNFVNSHGLPDPQHFTTAYDMAIILRHAITNDMFNEIFGARRYEMAPTNKQPESRHFYSRNSMINRSYEYEVLASKTGWTTLANHTLVTAARQGDRELIAVVLSSPRSQGKYEDTVKLFDYGFDEFYSVSLDVNSFKETALANLQFDNPDEVVIEPYQAIDMLIHRSLSIEDIETSFEIVEHNDNTLATVQFFLTLRQPSNLMHENLGDVLLTFETIQIAEGMESSQNATTFLLPGSVVGVLSLVLALIKRRRKKLRRYQYIKRFSTY